MKPMFDLVLFDLDGTLIETAPEICDAVNDTLRHFDLPEVAQQQVNDWIGHGTRELLIQALAFSGQTDVATVRVSDSLRLIAAEFDQHYQRRCGTRSHLYPQVRETLIALRERGVKLAVVTNKEGRYIATVLDAHQLMPLLDGVVSVARCPPKSRTRPVSRAAWRSLMCRSRGPCLWATPASTSPPRAMPASLSGPCRMATTWGNRSRRVRLIGSLPIARCY
jgi:phosphoglycolate phosphatase-like HAD superfamily hydrolase